MQDDLLAAVFDLATAPPHERGAPFATATEWRAYCQGYGVALEMALKVMDLAARAFERRRKTLRAEAKAKRSA